MVVRCGQPLRVARFLLPTRPTRCVAGMVGVSRLKDLRLRRGPFSRREAGVSWWRRWRGGLGSGWSGRWCVLSSAGHRRQSGTCREVKRRVLVAVLFSSWRPWTSRQDPARASPARPRREHTPRGSVWAAPGPGPRGPVDAESYITLMRPTRIRALFEGSRDLVESGADLYIAPILRPCGESHSPVTPDEGIVTGQLVVGSQGLPSASVTR